MPTMKAVRFADFGGPEVIEVDDVPRPEAGEGEVLIQVRAASINPIDWKVRSGMMSQFVHYDLPFILGYDVAGEVASSGPGAALFAPGEAVFAMTGQQSGAHAEYVALPAANVARKPHQLDFVQAAAVPLGALTAWQSIFDAAALQAGQTILVHAAGGGVGSMAVQLAKAKGARVIGTASAHNLDFLRELGVDEAIDYSTSRFEDVARDVDVVFDTIGGDTQQRSFGVLKKGGFLVSIVQPPNLQQAAAHGVRVQFVSALPNGAQLAEVATLIDAGKVRPIVQTVLPLAQARQAHELIESGHTRGKIVLQVS